MKEMIMTRFMFFLAVCALLLLPANASARGWRFRSGSSSDWYPSAGPPAGSAGGGYSYRAYSHQTPENRPIAVWRAPYSIESNVWRADRKMMQTYWYRD
jgi:hypothetical protein